MGRGPDEDDGEEHDRRPAQAVGDRRPADEDGNGAGRPADHDVLRRDALQPQRVDEDVEGGGRHGQHGRQQVDEGPQLGEGHHLEGEGEHQGRRRRHGPGDEGPVPGPPHQLVDVPVDHHVDGVGPAGGQGPAGQGGHHQAHRRHPPAGHEHGRQRGHEQQLDDPGLGEGHVAADLPRPDDRQGGRQRGHRRRAYGAHPPRDKAGPPSRLAGAPRYASAGASHRSTPGVSTASPRWRWASWS